MFTYSGKSTVQMAKKYRAEESADVPRATRTRKHRSPSLAPPSVLTSRWWVTSEGLRSGFGPKHGGTATPAW